MIALEQMPPGFPTQAHAPAFWEALGRAAGTFGFLEETLGKAIFAWTAMTRITEKAPDTACAKWTSKLEHALSDPLRNLIDSNERAVRDHGEAKFEGFDELIKHLEEAARLGNVLCHGSWNRSPDAEGRSIPFFVTGNGEKQKIFESPIDIGDLQQLQRGVAELACEVIDTVTIMGWQFPGTNGPGVPIFQPKERLAG